MGPMDSTAMSKHVRYGETIASSSPADHLLIAGVSNWGAGAVAGELALVGEPSRSLYAKHFTDDNEPSIFDQICDAGAVDGVTGKRTMSVDGISLDEHFEKYGRLRFMVSEAVI